MGKRVLQVPSQAPIVDNQGRQTQVFRQYTQSLTQRALIVGTGSPEGIVQAQQGALYMDETGTTDVLYIKQTGSEATGWVSV